jgi:hypothetical protein
MMGSLEMNEQNYLMVMHVRQSADQKASESNDDCKCLEHVEPVEKRGDVSLYLYKWTEVMS